MELPLAFVPPDITEANVATICSCEKHLALFVVAASTGDLGRTARCEPPDDARKDAFAAAMNVCDCPLVLAETPSLYVLPIEVNSALVKERRWGHNTIISK